jgi:hypothetical protein
MLSDDQKWRDRTENMVSIPCPVGDHIALMVPKQDTERKDELTGIRCRECNHGLDWPVPPKSS